MRFRQRARCVSLRALPLQRTQRGRVRIHCSASRAAAALARFTSGLLAAIMFENVACPGAAHHYSTRAKGNQHHNAGGKSCRNPRRDISLILTRFEPGGGVSLLMLRTVSTVFAARSLKSLPETVETVRGENGNG